MEKLYDFNKIFHLLERNDVEKVYPLSIIQGYQTGEIFVDDADYPSVALLWHYCGFANIVGNYKKKYVNEIVKMMHHPSEDHSGRMALQIGRISRLQDTILLDSSVKKGERYIFEHVNKNIEFPSICDCELKQITLENYDLIRGRIIPSFSWKSKEQFLQNGFGYCIFRNQSFAACAFSSGISNEYVDIGVETAEEFRGRGYGKIVASAMVKETYRRKKIPVWGCDITNEGSMRLACSLGFEIRGTHPWYKIESQI